MKQPISWGDIIPIDETEAAARFLVTTWNRIARAQPQFVQYQSSEPLLTERLCFYLKELSANSGLTGFWINEEQNALYKNGMLCDRIRKDITYCSNASSLRLELIFEFKKLSRTSLATYRGEKGMYRFVGGNYAIKKPFAAMVGILKERDDDLIEALRNSLSRKNVRSGLNMVCCENGQYIRCPSEVIPGLAEFETEHLRAPEKASAKGATTIAHIFLICEN